MTDFREVHGDHHNCACPHCGKMDHGVTRGVEVVFRKVTAFTRRCQWCGRLIFYRARWDIAVTAATHNPLGDLDRHDAAEVPHEGSSSFSRKLAADLRLAARCQEVVETIHEAAAADLEAVERSEQIGPDDLNVIINARTEDMFRD